MEREMETRVWAVQLGDRFGRQARGRDVTILDTWCLRIAAKLNSEAANLAAYETISVFEGDADSFLARNVGLLKGLKSDEWRKE